MSSYDHLVGLSYHEGKQDCYSLCRRYFADVWGLWLPNFARPTEFWNDARLNLYDQYDAFGFKTVHDEKVRVGDVLLMPLFTPMNTHAAVVVTPQQILHHLPGRLSSVEPLRPKWLGRTMKIIRHPEIKPEEQAVSLHEVIDAKFFRDPRVQEVLARAMAERSRTMRGDRPGRTDPGETQSGS